MAAKSRFKGKASPPRPTPRTAAQREQDRIQLRQREIRDSDFRQRHPQKAAEERALRKEQAERQRDFGHKLNGTIETHAKASRQRQGALARLYQSGAITIEQLGSALEIAAEVERIGADVSLKTANLETRIDVSRTGSEAFFESLGRVRREVAYTRWRAALGDLSEGMGVAPVLAMIVDDVGIVEVSRQFGIHRRRAKRVLIAAMDLWPEMLGQAMREIDADDVTRVELRLL